MTMTKEALTYILTLPLKNLYTLKKNHNEIQEIIEK